ncbi:MAG: LysE family translocator [Pararhizobium sp.]
MSFVPNLPTMLAFGTASLVLALTPGPDMTFFLSRALAEGTRAGLACVLGAMTGIAIHTLVVAFGLAALIVASPVTFLALKVAGAAYLLWLAFGALRHGAALKIERGRPAGRSFLANWSKGLGINLMNPKIIIFFMTFLPQFVSPGDPDVRGKLIFLGFLFVVVSLPVVIAIVFMADRLAATLKQSPRVTRVIDYLFGGVFSAFAVKILLTQGR